jgi:hypothetical protein
MKAKENYSMKAKENYSMKAKESLPILLECYCFGRRSVNTLLARNLEFLLLPLLSCPLLLLLSIVCLLFASIFFRNEGTKMMMMPVLPDGFGSGSFFVSSPLCSCFQCSFPCFLVFLCYLSSPSFGLFGALLSLSVPCSGFRVPPALRGFFFFPFFLPVQPWLCLFLPSSFFFFSGFYKARERGNQGEPRSSMRPTICSYRSPAETVLSDEEGGAFDLETAPFTTRNGNFHFGP